MRLRDGKAPARARHWPAALGAAAIVLGSLGLAPGAAGQDIDEGQAESVPLATLDFGGVTGTLATASVRAANSLTSSGLHIAPRYMTRTGDVDVSALGGLVAYPADGGGAGGGQVSMQARLSDGLTLLADLGEKTSLGLRGPLWADRDVTLGWDVRYRNDIFFYAVDTIGLSAPGFGILPGFPGAAAQGGQAALNGEYAAGPLRLNVSPMVSVLSNRSAVGAAFAADWDLDRLTLGYGADLAYNAVSPGNAVSQAFEQTHSAGVRFYWTDWAYAQANLHFRVADSYGVPTTVLLAGIGTRLLGNFARPEAPSVPIPVAEAPAPVAEPEATPEPEPTPGPAGAPVATEADWVSLKGRVYHSFHPAGDPGVELTVALKIKTKKGWQSIKETTKTDKKGFYVFRRLPDGDYQVVYRNEKLLTNVVGAAVSHSVSIRPKRTKIVDLDLAWDENAIVGKIAGNKVTVAWPGKPAATAPIYEVILKYTPDEPYIVGSPLTPGGTTSFDVSDVVKARKLYYTVKYWKSGGRFQGDNYYGQSNYKILEVGP